MPSIKGAVGMAQRKRGKARLGHDVWLPNHDGGTRHDANERRKRDRHARVEAAIALFLERGGTITKLTTDDVRRRNDELLRGKR